MVLQLCGFPYKYYDAADQKMAARNWAAILVMVEQ